MSTAAPSPRFSIIVVHRNGVELLLETLAAAVAAMEPGRDEFIVVDNGSSDGSVAAVRSAFPQVSLIENPCNNGFARANNQAIAIARGAFLLLLNNDARIEAGLLERMCACFEQHPRAALIAPQLLGPDGARQRSHKALPSPWRECGLRFLARTARPVPGTGVHEVEAVVGACMAVRRAALDAAGSLDDDFFFYYEETEWCHRLRARHWQVLLDHDSRVVHQKGASTRPHSRGARLELFRSRLLYYRKVFPGGLALLLTTCRVLRLLINCAASALGTALTLGLHRGLRRRSAQYAYLLGWLLAGMPAGWGLPDKCPERP